MLGAWRNNKFIAHDDDFDFGMLIESKDDIKPIFDIISKLLPNYPIKVPELEDKNDSDDT